VKQYVTATPQTNERRLFAHSSCNFQKFRSQHKFAPQYFILCHFAIRMLVYIAQLKLIRNHYLVLNTLQQIDISIPNLTIPLFLQVLLAKVGLVRSIRAIRLQPTKLDMMVDDIVLEVLAGESCVDLLPFLQ
jgi:hypothetical protein